MNVEVKAVKTYAIYDLTESEFNMIRYSLNVTSASALDVVEHGVIQKIIDGLQRY